jgi:hypothetical protein
MRSPARSSTVSPEAPDAVNNNDFPGVTIGYLIMRAGLMAQWLRVAFEVPAARAPPCDLRRAEASFTRVRPRLFGIANRKETRMPSPHEGQTQSTAGSLDGTGTGDHDVAYCFGRRPRVITPYAFSTRQYARLLVLRRLTEARRVESNDRAAVRRARPGTAQRRAGAPAAACRTRSPLPHDVPSQYSVRLGDHQPTVVSDTCRSWPGWTGR